MEDRAALAKSVLDNVAGLGLLPQHLDDPDVEEIWINSPAQVLSNSTSVRRSP